MFEIDEREINIKQPPYIIAELSANHNGSIDVAKKTILAAKESGANAIKLQTYTADSMTIDCNKEDFKIRGGLWDEYRLYDLYKEASTPYEWQPSCLVRPSAAKNNLLYVLYHRDPCVNKVLY